MDNEKFLGAQLVGSDPVMLKKATGILNRYEFNVIDFNLGCPAPKVTRKGEGAALGLVPEKALKAFSAIAENTPCPTTVKIRITDEKDPCKTIHICKKLENAGAQAITIHGRIKKAFYSGPVFYDIISATRENLNIPVIANGGITGIEGFRKIKENTGCNLTMVARGAIGNPWIFKEISRPEGYAPPTPVELTEEMANHIHHMAAYYGEKLAMKIARKLILAYLKGRGYPGKLKNQASSITSLEDFKYFLFEIRKGPCGRYWSWLKGISNPERKISPPEKDEKLANNH
jgi:tRNA-dihydrouridine synthase B